MIEILKIKKKLRSGSDEIRTRDPLVVSEISYPQTTEPLQKNRIKVYKKINSKNKVKKNFLKNEKKFWSRFLTEGQKAWEWFRRDSNS